MYRAARGMSGAWTVLRHPRESGGPGKPQRGWIGGPKRDMPPLGTLPAFANDPGGRHRRILLRCEELLRPSGAFLRGYLLGTARFRNGCRACAVRSHVRVSE
jgi:hypothetical protein